MQVAENPIEVAEKTVTFSSGSALVSACLCCPATPGPHPGVIVLHEMWGLTAHIKSVTRRLAHAGYAGLAIDLFSRAGGRGNRRKFDEMWQLRQGISDEMMLADVAAGIRYLREQPLVAGGIALLGFSMGARYAVLSACPGFPDIAAVVAYYCRVYQGDGSTMISTIHHIHALAAPLLAFYGETDRWTPPDEIEWLRGTLTERDKEHEIVVYPGAGHSFFDDTARSYRAEAARDSWTRTLALLKRRLGIMAG